MLRLMTLICLGLLVGCASNPPQPTKDSFEPDLMILKSRVELPMTPVGNHQWQVSAELGGVRGIFALDTGSETTVITPQFAEKIGLLKTATRGKFGGPNPLHQQVRYAKLNSAWFDGLLFANFYVPILSLDHLNRATHTHLDGILGNNILSKVVCSFDWKKHLLTLDPEPAPKPPNAIPIVSRKRRIFLNATVNGSPVEFAVDTGAYSSSITENELRRLYIPAAKISQVKIPRADIAEISPLQQTQASLDIFQLGPISRTNFPILTWHDNVIGMDLLEGGRLILNANAGWMSLGE